MITVILILFADFLGYGGASARKSEQNDKNEEYSIVSGKNIDKGACVNFNYSIKRLHNNSIWKV